MGRLVSPLFAGRERELRALTRALHTAAAGAMQCVLISSEAGGGKTRLIQEFATQVRLSALMLVGACVEQSDGGLPFAPLTGALRQLVRERGVTGIRAIVGETASELSWLLPEFGTIPTHPDAGIARARLFEVLRQLVEGLALQHPLVLVIEDAHWADRSTLDLLRFLIGNLRHAGVVLVISYRTEALDHTHALRRVLTELHRFDGVVPLPLSRLTHDEVATQLEGILGNPPLPALVRKVHERGDGVPLFTETLIGADGRVGPDLPTSLRDMLLGAVQRLPEPTQRVLQMAAGGGARVSHALLRAVTELGDAELASALRPAVAANVLVVESEGYAFRHALIRVAVRDDLLAGERAHIHRTYARSLEANLTLLAEPWGLTALALHWYWANAYEHAMRVAWRAVGEAATKLAFAEQLRMLELVLELYPQVPDAERWLGKDWIGVVEQAVEAACWAVELERGLALVEVALAHLVAEHEAERVAAMLLQRAIMRQQALMPGELGDLRRALRLASSPTRLRAEALGQTCRALMLRERHGEAKPLADELSILAAALGDEEFLIEAAITTAQLGAHDGLDPVPQLTQVLERARCAGLGRLELLAYLAILKFLGTNGDHERAIEIGRLALDRALLIGQGRYMGATVAQRLCVSLFATGRWDEALEVIEQALALDPAPLERAQVVQCSAEIAIARGEFTRASTALDELRAVPDEPQNRTQRTVGLTRLEIEYGLGTGDIAAALVAAQSVPTLRDADPRLLWPLLVAAVRAGVAAGAAELRQELEAVASALTQLGPVERAHGLTFAAEVSRTHQSDPVSWDAAGEAWVVLGQPYSRASALVRGGAAFAVTGNRDEATVRLRQAVEIARRLQATVLLAQLESVARRARINLDDDGRIGDDRPFGLTERELDVLKLIATGRSNREIAAELFISVKTASVHVSNILGKLEVATRGAAAATAHKLRLFEPA